jgi:hypothetical protein
VEAIGPPSREGGPRHPVDGASTAATAASGAGVPVLVPPPRAPG